MVGGRSLGCLTCKSRRIKCDEKWPVCSRCERAQRKCSGPLTPFIYEKGSLTASKRSKLESTAAAELRTYPLRVLQTLRPSPVLTSTKCSHMLSSPDSALTRAVPPPILAGAADILSMDFIQTLRATDGTGHDFNFIGAYLPYIPQRLGRSAALDAATGCLLFTFKAMLRHDSTCEEGQLSRYIHALRELRIELDGGKTTEETAGAALLICAFEVIKRTKKTSEYVAHAGGAAAVLKSLGPARINSEFGRALFFEHCGPVIASSLFSESECMLSFPGWCCVFREPWFNRFCRPFDGRIYEVYSSLPKLVRVLRLGTACLEEIVEARQQALSAQHRLDQLSARVDTAMADSAFAREIPSHRPDSPFSTYIRFSNLINALLPVTYWRLVILVDNILCRLSARLSLLHGLGLRGSSRESEAGPKLARQLQTKRAAENICKSLEFCLEYKPFGPVTMLYDLLAAYAVCGKECGTWLAKILVTEFAESVPVKGTIFDLASRYLKAVGLGAELDDLKYRIGTLDTERTWEE